MSIEFRRNTAALAATHNAVLAAGEPGYETDTGKFKIGDGVTAWVSLPYATVTAAQIAAGYRPIVTPDADTATSGALTPNQHAYVTTGGTARTRTLPTGQVKGSTCTVENADGLATLTVTGNLRGVGSSSVALTLAHEIIEFVADSAGSWWPQADHKTLSSLDARYNAAYALVDATSASSTPAAVVGQIVNCSTCGAAVTSPSVPSSVGTPVARWGVKNTSTSNITVTYPNTGGTSTTVTLLPDATRIYRQKSVSGWGVEGGDTPVSQLDARYSAGSLTGVRRIAASGVFQNITSITNPPTFPFTTFTIHKALITGSDWRLQFGSPLASESDVVSNPVTVTAGLEYPILRVDVSGTTSGSPTVTDPSILASDFGRTVTGTGVPSNTYVGTVTPGTGFQLSSAQGTQTNVNATATGTSTNLTLGAVIYPITWQGLASCTFVPGGVSAQSDPVSCEVPAGASFRLRSDVTTPFGTYVQFAGATAIGASSVGLTGYPGGSPGVTTAILTLDQSGNAEQVTVNSYSNTQRTDSVGTTSGSPVVTDTLIVSGDFGRPVTGAGIPAGSYVGTVVAGTSFRISSTSLTNTDANATATATVNATIGAAVTATLAAATTKAHATNAFVGGQAPQCIAYTALGEGNTSGHLATTGTPTITGVAATTTLTASVAIGDGFVLCASYNSLGDTITIDSETLTVRTVTGVASPYKVWLTNPATAVHSSGATVTGSQLTSACVRPLTITADRTVGTPPPCIIGLGDSIMQGTGFYTTGKSWIDYALDGVRPFYNIGKGNETAQGFATALVSRRRRTLLPLGQWAVIMYGRNDLYNGNRTAVQIEGDISTIAAFCHNRGLKVALCTVLPDTTSTDGWTTTTNQTAYVGAGSQQTERINYNTWVRGSAVSAGVADIVLDMAATVETALNSNIWGVASGGVPLTIDGIHPDTLTYKTLIAPVLVNALPIML